MMSKDAKLHKKFIQGEISAKDAIRQALAHGISAGRASMKAEIVAIVKLRRAGLKFDQKANCHTRFDDYQVQAKIAEANEIITRIERTET